MPRSALYDDLLMEMLKDEERALAYLNAALDEQDPRIFLIALRNVTLAQEASLRLLRVPAEIARACIGRSLRRATRACKPWPRFWRRSEPDWASPE